MFISDITRKNASLYPNRVALIDGYVKIKFSEFNQRVNRLANAIVNLGLSKGDRIAVLSENTYQYMELYFACAKAGLPIVPLNYRSASEELVYVISDSSAKLIFFGSRYLNVVKEIEKRCSSITGLICINQELSDLLFYEDLLKKSASTEPDVKIEEDDIVVLGYTGGTTGRPKGVMTTHKNLVSSCFNIAIAVKNRPGNIYLDVAPMFHAGDAMAMFAFFFVGGTNVMLSAFSPEAVVKTIEQQSVTHVLLVPAMILAILRYPQLSDFNIKSLECVIYGTAPMPTEPLRKAIQIFPCKFLQVYGATETFVPMSILSSEDHVLQGSPEQIRRMSSAGREVIGVEIKIADDHDKEVPIGDMGEVIVRGDNVMKGYWKLPELTSETLRNGWYHTGDIGKMDEDRYVYIVDRKKDMIISGGENIYPQEIENVLFQHPGVADAAVIGVPDDTWGEAIKALIVRTAGSTVTEAELLEYCKQNLASFKKPHSVDFVDHLPHSTAGKLLKYEIRAQYWKDRDQKV
jgi:long-chain acyl-CoA synthetase